MPTPRKRQAGLERDDDGHVHDWPARRSARRCWAAHGDSMMRGPDAPSARSASRNGRSLIVSVCARAMRPNCGMKTTVTRMMMLSRPGPSTATSAKRQDQARKGADDVEDGEDRAFHDRRGVGGDDTEQDAEHQRRRRYRKGDADGDPRAVEARAKRGRGRDGRRRANARPTAASAAPRRRSGSAGGWRSAARPARRKSRSSVAISPSRPLGLLQTRRRTSPITLRSWNAPCRDFRARAGRARHRTDRPAGWSRRRWRRRPGCRPARSDSCGSLMASKISEPRPGRLKMISTNTAPPISSPMPTPRMATVGMQASFSAYFITTRRSGWP